MVTCIDMRTSKIEENWPEILSRNMRFPGLFLSEHRVMETKKNSIAAFYLQD